MIKSVKLLWDFGRPHTLIGSTLSITTLFLLASGVYRFLEYADVYWKTLVAALACNVFITGLNQIVDVDMDKINKPFLPIAAGRLSIPKAKLIIYISLIVCLGFSISVDVILLGLMLLILLIGILYSVPPIRLKKHHLPASLCIVLVRGLIVNLGIGFFFELIINGRIRASNVLIPLTVFMMAFSLAIAWFKDLYDVDGDKAYKVKTLAVLYSIPFAFKIGSIVILSAYLFNMFYVYLNPVQDSYLLFWGNALLGIAYCVLLLKSSMENREGVYRFYMNIWIFFFAQYLLYLGYALWI